MFRIYAIEVDFILWIMYFLYFLSKIIFICFMNCLFLFFLINVILWIKYLFIYHLSAENIRYDDVIGIR